MHRTHNTEIEFLKEHHNNISHLLEKYAIIPCTVEALKQVDISGLIESSWLVGDGFFSISPYYVLLRKWLNVCSIFKLNNNKS